MSSFVVLFCRGVVVFRFRRWWLLCGAVLVGVVALNGVVDAKAGPARGSVCVRVGAKALDGVSGRGFVCANQSSWVALAVCANCGDDYDNCTEHVGYDNGCSCECCAAGCVGVGCDW